MEERRQRLLKLFGKEVYQTAPFTRSCQAIGPGTAEQIVAVTATFYPLFRQLKHKLVLGQLSPDCAQDYVGPPLQFIYKVLPNKTVFAFVRVGGFTEQDVAAIETAYDL